MVKARGGVRGSSRNGSKPKAGRGGAKSKVRSDAPARDAKKTGPKRARSTKATAAAPAKLRASKASPARAAAPKTASAKKLAHTPNNEKKTPTAADTLPQGTSREPAALHFTSANGPPAPDALHGSGPERPSTVARATQLDWDDTARTETSPDALVERWARRGDELLARLAAHGVSNHEYRADLREGRFVWVAPDGRVSAEARAQVLCSWSRATSVVAMAWADPLVRQSGVPRLDGMPSERDDVDEEQAWHIAMEAAEAAGAEYLYRVPTPHAWYFLALRDLTFAPARDSFCPSTPVGLVLRELGETRQAIESRAEPAQVIKRRLQSVGDALLHQARYAYRNTDWVARLERTGKRMLHLASLVPRGSYSSVAAGRGEEWLARDLATDLIHAISLLEDEWNAFA